MSNKRLLKDWLQEAGFYATAPNLKSNTEAKMPLKKLISLKHSNLAALNFNNITMRWQDEDIYATAKSMLQYSRKADSVNNVEVGGEDCNGEGSDIESHLSSSDTCATSRKYMHGDCLSSEDETTLCNVTKSHPNCEHKTGPEIAYIEGASITHSKELNISSLELPPKTPKPFFNPKSTIGASEYEQ